VLDTGTRQLVIIDRGDNTFEPRDVRVGTRGNGYAELLDGVREGELVVVNGNFLIDAESNLRAAIGGSVRPGSTPKAAAAPAAPAAPAAHPEH
jgi:multidrug efflux pump subunit AcrA (membrane-fusion protein)